MANSPQQPRARQHGASADPATGRETWVDGRRRRAERSRARIVAAMMDLIRAGNLAPSADAVATRAAVGLRTVFRLFKDTDSLYREIAGIMRARLLPLVEEPVHATEWRAALHEVVHRRARLFEEMLPFKTAADAQRVRSTFLTREHEDVVRLQRDMLLRVLPRVRQRDRMLVEALDVATSFEAWRRLRHDQQLGVADAEATVTRLVDALVGAAPTRTGVRAGSRMQSRG